MLNHQIPSQLTDYLLCDYLFLEDYDVVQSSRVNRYSFVAHIRDTEQKVRFIKRRFILDQFDRFKALHKLYKNGIVLADNMFILEECEQLYFYIIEAEIQMDNPRFETLQMYLYARQINQQERKGIVSKIKVLIDCLHQEGQAYAGLDPRKIIIDQDKHLYLAPFDLQFELRKDNFSRAYYPPQCLVKIQNGQSQLNEQFMLKWDIWSFGCIALQTLKYASPVFMSTSLNKQLKMIEKMRIEELNEGFQDSLQNVIANSLNKDNTTRTISIHKIQREESIQKEVYSYSLPEKTDSKQSKYLNNINQTGLRELNLHKNDEKGDSELILNLFSLSGIEFERELHLTVHLGKQFHFYIDSHDDGSKKYQMGRRVSIRGNFDELTRMLTNPVLVQLEESGLVGKVNINLQTLVLVHEGRRIWNQQLLGTYTVDEGDGFIGAKLKISSVLLSPDILTNQPQKQYKQQMMMAKQSIQKDIQQKIIIKPEKIKQKQVQQQSKPLPKKKKDKKNEESIPSISQIAQNIVLFTNEFKKKMAISEKGEDQIQLQLQTLLEIK